MKSHIKLWTKHLSMTQSDLGGLAVCPYAARAKYKILDRVRKKIRFEKDQTLLETLDVLLYLKEFRMKKKDMYELCDQLNGIYIYLSLSSKMSSNLMQFTSPC